MPALAEWARGARGGGAEISVGDFSGLAPNGGAATDSTPGIQAAIDAASALAVAQGLDSVRVGGFGSKSYMIGALLHAPRVHLDLDGARLMRRANVSQPMIRNVLGPLVGGSYYGKFSRQKITGGTWDPNGYGSSGNGNIIQLLFCDGLTLGGGFTVLHNSPPGDEAWAICIGGRNLLTDPTVQVLGGDAVFEDGIHMFHGQNARLYGYVESGDDAFAVGGEPSSPILVASPDPIRDVKIDGIARSEKGYALSIYANTGAAGANWEVTDVEATVVGRAGITRNGGMRVHDFNGPALGAELLRRIRIRADLEVGSAGHDDTGSPDAIRLFGAADTTVDAKLKITEGTGAATGFVAVNVAAGSDVDVGVECGALGKRFGVVLNGPLRATVRGTLRGGQASHLWMSGARDVTLRDYKFLDVANTQAAITLSSFAGAHTYGKIGRGEIAHVSPNAARTAIFANAGVIEPGRSLLLEGNDWGADGADADNIIVPATARAGLTIAPGNVGVNPSKLAAGRKGQTGEWAVPSDGWIFGTGIVPTASNYRLVRWVPSEDMLLTKVGFLVLVAATTNDAVDGGIYDVAGARLGASGATAGKVNGALGKQTVDLAAAVYVQAGRVYYLGLAYGAIGGTAATLGNLTAQSAGPASMWGATAGTIELSASIAGATLPATATFAATSSQAFQLAGLAS